MKELFMLIGALVGMYASVKMFEKHMNTAVKVLR